MDVHNLLVTTLTNQLCGELQFIFFIREPVTDNGSGLVNEEGLSHQNVGVLLLTKEALEGGGTIRTL